jgi:hypothetical protein
MPTAASSLALPPTAPACAVAAMAVNARTAAEPGNQGFRATMISCAVRSRLFWEEHASCTVTRLVSSAGVDPALPADPRNKSTELLRGVAGFRRTDLRPSEPPRQRKPNGRSQSAPMASRTRDGAAIVGQPLGPLLALHPSPHEGSDSRSCSVGLLAVIHGEGSKNPSVVRQKLADLETPPCRRNRWLLGSSAGTFP